MSTELPFPLADEILHSHSDLTRQLEEMEAHACALRSPDNDTAEVLDDLNQLAERFVAEVHEHIAEEEEVVFPKCRPHLTASARAMLHRILSQHRELETSLQRLIEYIDRARQHPNQIHRYLIESICLRTRLLRYTFTVHSEEERQFFREVFPEYT